MKIVSYLNIKIKIATVIIWSSGALACDVSPGRFTANLEESKQLLGIYVMESGFADIIQEDVYLDDKVYSDKIIYSGYWSCQGDQFLLEYSVEKISGKIVTASLKKDLGIDLESKTIVFPKSKEANSIVGGWRFWPEEFIKNAVW